MKTRTVFFTAILVFLTSGVAHSQVGSTIVGRVVDEHNVSVFNAFVELYNNYHVMIGTARSSSQGRYMFRGLKSGRYTVHVRPFGSNLLEDSQVVEITNLTASSSDVEIVDFRLEIDKRFENKRPTLTGTVYAQEISSEAKQKFDSGLSKLKSGNDAQGLSDLEAAVKIFPTYFDALSLLGKEYVSVGRYKDGYETLFRAIQVYKRCGDCYYSLAVAFYRLNEIPAGVQAASAAMLLAPLAPEAHLLNGILLRISNDFPQALSELLKAEALYEKPNPEIHWQLSLVYNSMNKNSDAADRLELYLRDSPELDKKRKESIKDLIAKLRAAKDSKK